MDPDVVEKGFYITRTIEEIRRIYDELVAAGRMNPNTGNRFSEAQFSVSSLFFSYLYSELSLFKLTLSMTPTFTVYLLRVHLLNAMIVLSSFISVSVTSLLFQANIQLTLMNERV